MKRILPILAILLIFLAGCAAPKCYPPNEIIDNRCGLDENDNDVTKVRFILLLQLYEHATFIVLRKVRWFAALHNYAQNARA